MVIGDIVRSKALPERGAFQRSLQAALKEAGRQARKLASPYTITLGDEFQAVYQGAESLFADLFGIMAKIHPTEARFAIGVGEISTQINRKQALGMDGPPFHRARSGMIALKETKGLILLEVGDSGPWTMANQALDLLSSQVMKWESNRLEILARLLRGETPASIAARLRISKPALYKNISAGGLKNVAELCREIARNLDASLFLART
ncbi:MAG TPA: SatD family protein [Opitutaceae bacterium]|nr:SatD family protein [Opitutaceae bacterium]